ncbi:MAG TPA: HlyC/CorC family transporter [Bacteroidetes bacterium]|nr:HlyC/CorC family transporter [Bacteroidota bacterium]
MLLLVTYFMLAILFSFLCSIWEAVLLSINLSFVQIQIQEKTSIAKDLKAFKDNIDRPLSAILTLNTIAHTVGAIMVGVQASKVFGNQETVLGLPINGEALVAGLMTLAILILSEIIPKTLGATYWKQLASFTIRSLKIIMFPLRPLIWLSEQITKLLKKEGERSVLSRADFSAMAELGEKEGIFADNESKIIKNLLRFNTIQAKDIMTPRTVVLAADENTTVKEFYDSHKKLRFSRIPIYSKTKDHISAYVLKYDLLSNLIDKKEVATLKSISRNIMIINEGLAIPELFNKFMETREHIALVVDEFGGMAGIVTMEDVIETLLGLEILDESDNIEDMQALARKNWEQRAKKLGIIEKPLN